MIGETIPHYRIRGLLGRGGMGEVHEAEDVRLGRAVALKVLRGSLDPVRRARFEREAQAAARLDHPNIGVIYEIGETPEGDPFIAMSLYSGGTLRERLEGGPLALEDAVRTAAGLAAGLGAAHQAGIVHRDVKPENIVVTDEGMVKVIDFGIAKLTDVDPLTQPDAITGSVHYMAPEQAGGADVDARADVWAFGVLFYELIAGRRPFEGLHPAAVLYQAAHEEPEPLDSSVPAHLRGVIETCLQKDPQDRYADAVELAAALSHASVPRSAPRWSLQRPIAYAVAAVAVLAALVLGLNQVGDSATDLYQLGRADLAQSYDAARVASAITYFERALGKDSTLAGAEAALGEALVYQGKAAGDSALAERAQRHADRATRLAPELPDAHVTLGMIGLWLGTPRKALGQFRLALRYDSTQAQAWEGVGNAYFDIGEYEASMNAYRHAIRLAPDDWSPHANLGFVQYVTGGYEEAARAWERATVLAPSNIDALSNQGALLFSLDRFEEAAAVFERLVAVNPDGDAYANLGTSYFYQAQFSLAAEQYERALQHSPGDYEKLGYLAATYRELGNRSRAEQTFQQAVDRLQATSGWTKDPIRLSKLASYQAALGERAKAVALLDQLMSPPPAVVSVLVNIAATYGQLGDRPHAVRWTCRALRAGYSPALAANTPSLSRYRDGPEGWSTCRGQDSP